jgi:hypothetical protein
MRFSIFGFDGHSFYTCDETWNQEDEISLLTRDVIGKENNELLHIIRAVRRENTKKSYVYDFINMWTFLVSCCS